jgi:hypothetical protein
MNFRFTVVEMALNRAEFRWKLLRFLRGSMILGIVVGLLVLGFGALVLAGIVSSKSLGTLFFIALMGLGFVAWISMAISVFAGSPDRDRLGSALERVDRRLLDRLNTLLFLERRRADPRAESFALRIARQTQRVVAEAPLASPFSSMRPTGWLIALLTVVAGTLTLYRIYSPLDRLVASQRSTVTLGKAGQETAPFELPTKNNLERSGQWGEVRITDPGRDLKVTKLAVVPLQIEAAANQALKEVSWFSSINGRELTFHSLPRPEEPRYAVYQPSLNLAELPLSDWDVVSYHAEAATENSNVFASQVYFVEVRPFREQLVDLPGGEQGKAYKFLSDLSGLISRQEQVIRQTHSQVQLPEENRNRQETERQKLALAERDLGDSVRNLSAEMGGSMEKLPVAKPLEKLANAEKSLGDAGKLLERNALAEAELTELGALAEMVAARKEFQTAASQNAKAFEQAEAELPQPGQLSEIASFREEAKAAQGAVRRALEQQRGLEQKARTGPSATYPRLGEQQKQIGQDLKDYQGQRPEAFKASRAEAAEADRAMKQSAEALRDRHPESPKATDEATSKLEDLSESVAKKSAARQLADAYKLKQMIEQQMQTFGKCANPGGDGSGGGDLKRAAGESRQTVNQLRKAAEEEPTRDAFGDPLREALSGPNKVSLEATLSRLEQPLDEGARQQGAAAARDALGKVRQAFEESEPTGLRMARRTDSLQAPAGDRFRQGMADLSSLIKQLENGRPLPAADQARQGREALYGIQSGLRNQHGGNERGNQLVGSLKETVKAEDLDVGDLKKLMEQLQVFSVENSYPSARAEDKPEVTNIDPSRMAPAYRGRIQKYFQKLSEK